MGNSIYKPVSLEVGNLLKDVQTGKIGLPDLQRPFVWQNNKVRDLLDSMLRGYPVGYVMLWESPDDAPEKKSSIGANKKAYDVPKELVIDGQQRLTALLACLYGVPVRDKNFKERTIRIAYDPVARLFKNADASTDKDARFIPNVSDAFAAKRENRSSLFRRAFIQRLNEANEKRGDVACDEDAVENGINALLELEGYLLPTLEISDDADEETVSEIFVRVNSQGQALKQDDFIMTLLSVYEPEMRERIARFCEDSHTPAPGTSYNALVRLTPSLIIRTVVGVGFKRGRLRSAYQVLRGRDLKTKEASSKARQKNFAIFGSALDRVLNLNNWHDFISALAEAGYVCSEQVSSANALAFCYAFYLIGKYEFGLAPLDAKRLARRWFFVSALTGLYVGSFESEFERQLTDISKLNSADSLLSYFERSIDSLMTDDYYTVTLPHALDVSGATGPSWSGFIAAQVVLGAKEFFGMAPLQSLLVPGASGTKKAYDKHHIFPDNYLKQHGQATDRNSRANFTLVHYESNIAISDEAPSVYVARFREEPGEEAYERCCREHALPRGFESLMYEDFLQRRRALMAELIRKAFSVL